MKATVGQIIPRTEQMTTSSLWGQHQKKIIKIQFENCLHSNLTFFLMTNNAQTLKIVCFKFSKMFVYSKFEFFHFTSAISGVTPWGCVLFFNWPNLKSKHWVNVLFRLFKSKQFPPPPSTNYSGHLCFWPPLSHPTKKPFFGFGQNHFKDKQNKIKEFSQL